MGLNHTTNNMREKYLVIHVCEQEYFEGERRFISQPAHQQMVPLAKIRLQQSSRTLDSCAGDLGGPFVTKQGRGNCDLSPICVFYSV